MHMVRKYFEASMLADHMGCVTNISLTSFDVIGLHHGLTGSSCIPAHIGWYALVLTKLSFDWLLHRELVVYWLLKGPVDTQSVQKTPRGSGGPLSVWWTLPSIWQSYRDVGQMLGVPWTLRVQVGNPVVPCHRRFNACPVPDNIPD